MCDGLADASAHRSRAKPQVHNLRRTAVSLAISDEKNTKAVQRVFRHESWDTTLDVWAVPETKIWTRLQVLLVTRTTEKFLSVVSAPREDKGKPLT